MKRYFLIVLPVLLAAALVFTVVATVQGSASEQPLAPTGTAFTYQGRLNHNNQLVNGTCSISVSLWDSVSGGVFINSNTFTSVPVTDGLFNVQLDYGQSAFTGQERWLETAVRCAGDANYITLSPRTKLTAAPYALYALNNWGLSGNTGAGSGNFLGTLDNTPLNLGSNGNIGLRIQPTTQSPNIIGGYAGNYISPTIYGGTISGGGAFFYENRVMQIYGTVGGGRGNHADKYGTTIAGGIDNQATNDYATVAGGLHNLATGGSAGIGGGFYNIASGYVAYIGGGDLNVAATQNATIGGGYSNTVTGGLLIANGTIGGGVFNKATGFAATIAGGHGNQATGEWSTLGGGGFNQASNRSTTVGGGEYNLATGAGSTIGGGGWNGSGSSGNQAQGTSSSIGGGYGNLIAVDGGYGTIGGGQQNQISAPPGTNLNIATIGGGYNNKIMLGGGTIAGGNSNTASGFDAAVGGGYGNTASGGASTIPGGNSNLAQGNTSFAAGYRAKSFNNGCFTWADSNNFDFGCTLDNAFTVRATGGAYFASAINGSGVPIAGAQLSAGSSSWSALSDRDSKADFSAIDSRQVLEKLAQIPITTWRYKAQEPSIRHIGPMAQDFMAAFGVGEDEKHISTVDSDGVALAAIQGLYQVSREKDAEIAQQQQQIADLQAQVDALERRLDDLDPAGAPRMRPLPFNLSTLFSLAALGGVALLWTRGKKARRSP